MTGQHRNLDTNELMKIINLSYIDSEDEEIDIDSNLNLQDALRVNQRMRDAADDFTDVPCLKIFVKVNRRIVPIDADKSEQYLAVEDFKNESTKDRFSQLIEDRKEQKQLEPTEPEVKKDLNRPRTKGLFADFEDDDYVPGQINQEKPYEVPNHLDLFSFPVSDA